MTGWEQFADLLRHNAFWWIGNTGLAWAGVLLAWQVEGPTRRARIASAFIFFGVWLGVCARLRFDPGGVSGVSFADIAIGFAIALAALVWTVLAQGGHRWAQAIAVIGAVLFAPNAPYVVTDGMHYITDIRFVDSTLARSTILAVIYGTFTAVGLTAWVTLLDLGRAALGRRWSLGVLAGASLLGACAIYVGRVERIHSWHPVTHPEESFGAFRDMFTHAGPLAFVAVWTAVLFVVSVAGLFVLDLIRRRGLSAPRAIAAASCVFAGAWIAGMPLVTRFDRIIDIPTPTASLAATIAAVLLGVVLAVVGAVVAREAARPLRIAGSVALTLVLAVLLVASSTTSWWVQERGLCHEGPDPTRCR